MKYVNFLLLAFVSVVLSAGSVPTDKAKEGYYPGEILPNIALKDVEGKTLNLSDYAGKKVVVNFWAAYDATSRASNVLLHNFLKENYPDVALLSISYDESVSVFRKTVEWDNLDTLSQYCDANGSRSEIYKDFKLEKGFKSYLINEEGVITAMNLTPEILKKSL